MTGVRREVGKIFRGSATGPIHAAGAVDPNQVGLGVDVFILNVRWRARFPCRSGEIPFSGPASLAVV